MFRTTPTNALVQLKKSLEGELYFDKVMRTLYATDASAYREMPLAVALPKTEKDIQVLIQFAHQHQTALIPRTAGTSLAGQVVGNGIVTDVSKYFNQILEINAEEKWVRVQPGVVRDDLNLALKDYGLFFAPETSTANRAMIGGMIGNNSCGSNSIVYGSTREHLLEVKGFLSDSSEVIFQNLNEEQLHTKRQQNDLEGKIYQTLHHILSNPDNIAEIQKEFPKANIPRRNTGYALDYLTPRPSSRGEESLEDCIDLCKLIAGSEGTLFFITEAKLNLVPLPPKEKALVCCHFNSIDESLRANLIALKYQPSACELIDHYILECTRNNKEQTENSFFVQGDPQAILVVELVRENRAEIESLIAQMTAEMQAAGFGFHFPVVWNEDAKKVWNLRKAGLGLLSNMVGDAKPVPVVEDTAVDVQELPEYIQEFNLVLKKHGMNLVHYAHAGSGELHLRPILNLKTEEGNRLFRTIAEEIAVLVKKYKGSLSGEHGDGRLRGEFIKQMVGEKNYALMRQVKETFDPHHIFNPNKIIDTPPMNEFLRYTPNQKTLDLATTLDFDASAGIVRMAEMCNGSGDCRKTHLSGGTMCPSYMATRNEKDTTRARANILREVLTRSKKMNPFASEEIKEVMDLCLSCKGCKSECPSNVDVGKMKAEFLHQYYQTKGVPFRTRLIGNFTRLNQIASKVSWLYNFAFQNPVLGYLGKSLVGFHPKRSMPHLAKQTFQAWYKSQITNIKYQISNNNQQLTTNQKQLYLFVDEFSNFNDAEIAKKAVLLLEKLGYVVQIVPHGESGRTYLSKGLLTQAKRIAEQNVLIFKDKINENTPLVGIEPSAILGFRDEYIDLLTGDLKESAKKIAVNAFTFEEFIAKEMDKGNITTADFTEEKRLVKVHGHCHQKAISSMTPTKKMLSLAKNYEIHMIASGCCGMAGSFGYEKEHYEISMQIGELVLFPTVRKQDEKTIICAAGTSCRHQIKDGTGRIALHPIEVLWEALV